MEDQGKTASDTDTSGENDLRARLERRAELVLKFALEMSLGAGTDYAGAASESQLLLCFSLAELAKMSRSPAETIQAAINVLKGIAEAF